MKKTMTIITILIAAVGLLIFWGNKYKAQEVKYTAEELANILKEKNQNVGRIVVYNEETDINELLGRPNQYVSKATFEDIRVEQTNQYLDKEYFSQEEINEPIGGTIEVFKTEKDMQKRKEYLEEVTSSFSVFAEYSYGKGQYLLRLSQSITPTEAKEYEKIFYEILN